MNQLIFRAVIPLFMFLLLNIQCTVPSSSPEGRTPHSFKLTEHPDAFITEGIQFSDVRGEVTLADDTRQGFLMGKAHVLVFDVYLPAAGILKFAYGVATESRRYGQDLILSVTAEDESGKNELGSFDKKQLETWIDASIPVPEGIGGDYRLTFSLSGLNKGAPPEMFFLAHPVIIDSDNGDQPKRVIWISVDTLRADHLGCYGYERPTSPHIDSFAEDALLFERCISVCPWTFPSYSAMFTGRYPSITGSSINIRYVPETERTLAQILSASDIATFSVYSIDWVGVMTGLNRGFDTSRQFTYASYANEILSWARKWILQHQDEDFIVFIHLMDPHHPYKPKENYRDTFDPEYSGRFKHKFGNFEKARSGEMLITKREQEHLEALYDENILGCDEDIGDFIGFLKDNGLYEDSLVIINADHGEEFWERGGFGHGHQLYDELIHVPLIIRGPGFKRGEREESMCASFDVFPTILEWFGMDVPEEINARSLFDLREGIIEPDSRYLLSEELLFGIEQKAVSTDEYRYIYHTLDSSEELYDVTDDPGMEMDVVQDRRGKARNFRYFVTEYTLNQGSGWHVHIVRPRDETDGYRYRGTITSQTGFLDFTASRIDKGDVLSLNGNILSFDISVEPRSGKAFDFKTVDENDDVVFEIKADNRQGADGFVFIGPEKIPAESSKFTLSILDPMFGIGQPQLRRIGYHGIYIWGNSEALREETLPEMDDETREELRSLGYLM